MKTRILPASVYILTAKEELDYDRGGYDRETILESLNGRFGESESPMPKGKFTEVRRRDGRVIGRFFKGNG
jgi:hypothetical protein